MHMADALISPAVGAAFWVAAVGTAAYSIKKVQQELDEKKIPLMGVMGAFVFAVQMINFAIPGTGSSGHLGGGILLAALLGPFGGFLTMASILFIQALFFADGGLLALGCNIFNLGFFTCFIAYPFLYKWIVRKGITAKRIFGASLTAAIVGLQMGAFSVVLETFLAGKTELPFGAFLLVMQPIHLAIGVAEGLVTAAIITFVWRAHPEILEPSAKRSTHSRVSYKGVIIGLLLAAAFIAGVFSWFASNHPDGLEWSMFKVSGQIELAAGGGVHETLSDIQNHTAILPDYGFKASEGGKVGTSAAGLVGGGLTLLLAVMMGIAIRWIKKRKRGLNVKNS